ncbi:MAG: T9SS type A sorting domain-containing protein [Bacteroidetes bacterium]|nr:T9SS type A sorting domain-containing protein [Bacteroidota bacterium]
MRTAFPEFLNYLKVFFLVAFLTICTLNLNAQTSFDLRIDGLVSGNPTETRAQEMKPCADGGFIMTGMVNWGDEYIVIKTDSIGNVEWSKKFIMGNEIDPPAIIATNDSGFYFLSNQLDGFFGMYNVPTISKVDKSGNIVKSGLIHNNQPWIYGNRVAFCEVDTLNNDLLMMGTYYEYNGSNGPCCYEYYLFKLDSAFNVIFSTRLDNLVPDALRKIDMRSKRVYLNNQVTGYIATGLRNYFPPYSSFVYYLDSIGNLVWTRKYDDLEFKDFVQVGNNLFFISSKDLGASTYNSKIIKTDLSGNIILSKELQVSGSILIDGISVNANGELLMSGSHFSLPLTRSNLLLLSDTSLNVIMAKVGLIPSLTLISWSNSLPVGNSNSMLFSTTPQGGNLDKAIFEKIDWVNPLCNYTNLLVTTIPVTIVYSTLNYANLPYALTLMSDTVAFIPEYFNYSSPCLTSGVEGIHADENYSDLSVNPNPAKDYIELSFNGAVSSSEVTIFNITGEAVFKIKMDENNRKIPITDLTPGIYFVNVITEKQQFNAKFIKL